MEITWFIILCISLCISVVLKSIFSTKIKAKQLLPPGPPTVPVVGNFLWLLKSFSQLESVLRNLHAKYGPMVTLWIGPSPNIFISNRSIAHQTLIQNGSVFADRPPASPSDQILSSNQHEISSAPYGPTWRLLRRNLTSQMLHPSRLKSYSPARKWVLQILIHRFNSPSKYSNDIVDHFRHAMFCLLVFMCFGNNVKENEINEIETVLHRLLLSYERFNILNFWPSLGKILFRKRWNELFQLRKTQEDVLIPLIRARKMAKLDKTYEDKEDKSDVLSYVHTLLDLQLPEEEIHRKLDEGEMVSLCSEFVNAGTDTTSTALQWIMANMVKYPHVQAKLLEEIKGVMVRRGKEGVEVKEEDLEKMAYLKAVILEGLRRHPPAHFVLPHAVTQDVTLDGYLLPKKGSINFMVAEMGWDSTVWEDPMEFKPERFLSGDDGAGEVFDITGSREIKMMPFGAGRRICPGYGLAMLHLEYFVANLVWYFEWKAVDGDDVDLSEKLEFTTVMKNPLRAHISPRFFLN